MNEDGDVVLNPKYEHVETWSDAENAESVNEEWEEGKNWLKKNQELEMDENGQFRIPFDYEE
jgi:hypothetical protein